MMLSPSRSAYRTESGGVVRIRPRARLSRWPGKSKYQLGQDVAAAARIAASETATITNPGGASQPFCHADTTTSIPSASTGSG
jgi:hypothetical protein